MKRKTDKEPKAEPVPTPSDDEEEEEELDLSEGSLDNSDDSEFDDEDGDFVSKDNLTTLLLGRIITLDVFSGIILLRDAVFWKAATKHFFLFVSPTFTYFQDDEDDDELDEDDDEDDEFDVRDLAGSGLPGIPGGFSGLGAKEGDESEDDGQADEIFKRISGLYSHYNAQDGAARDPDSDQDEDEEEEEDAPEAEGEEERVASGSKASTRAARRPLLGDQSDSDDDDHKNTIGEQFYLILILRFIYVSMLNSESGRKVLLYVGEQSLNAV